MADDSTKIGSASGLDAALTQSTSSVKSKNEKIGQDEFLQLLVTQLKNQDPLDPSKPEEFAVNLAQFSQLEQLVSINDKIGGGEQGNLSSMAAYLGTEVTLDTDKISVQNKDGGLLRLDLADKAKVTVDLIGPNGGVVDTLDFGEVAAGQQTLKLDNLDIPSGEYSFAVKALSASGEINAKPKVAGIVSGFIPGPEPTLIVNGTEISPSKVTAVNLPKSA